jgi:peptidyl-prolyl cis-trans isomerase B (cyclophilin B)
LRHPLPEIRAEAANAIAQATQGLNVHATAAATGRKTTASSAGVMASAASALTARMKIEAEPAVRASICEALARLPYTAAGDVERAEGVILAAAENATITDRLGVAKGLEALVRLHQQLHPPGARVFQLLNDTIVGTAQPEQDRMRDARVRRLALETLIAGGAMTEQAVEHAAADPDPQVRRLAMQAIAVGGRGGALVLSGLDDPAGMVRREALRALHIRAGEEACVAAVRATRDTNLSVALTAIDQLRGCADSPDAIAVLDRIANDRPRIGDVRAAPRAAHALVALAAAAPDQARPALAQFVTSSTASARLYAARAAAQLHDREVLEKLAGDGDDRVANAALTGLGMRTRSPKAAAAASTPLNTADLRRLAAPRARVTIRDVGRIDVALFTSEAPATVLRFAAHAQAGDYNGRSFGRVNPGMFVQSGDATWDDPSSRPGAEVGLWPHVRGAVGIANRGTASGDPEFFIDLVDSPRLDHEYVVFGQVLNGMDLLDQISEGDIIESIEILP